MTYRSLEADRIAKTIETLYKRIEERFPGRGLGKLCAELLNIAREDERSLNRVTRPNFWLRAGVVVAVATAFGVIAWFVMHLRNISVSNEAFNAIQGIDAAVNTLALAAGASWFLLNLETVWRRREVLMHLHELRSIAHVVDMHQLTKDPTTLHKGYTSTASSQTHDMNEFELVRYLDYCSEMLSLTGKLAALYMQNMRDPVVIEAVNEIEDLTTSLSRKIWQKIMILRQPGEPWGQ